MKCQVQGLKFQFVTLPLRPGVLRAWPASGGVSASEHTVGTEILGIERRSI